MTEPLVSVRMITYNHALYIAQAIEGVLQQRVNFALELVIGEDGSSDGTKGIVLKYQEKYPQIIRVITSEENVGMKKNGYRTTKACRGKYLAYCDGDDYWHHPLKLQKQVDYLESHPECGLVYSSYDVYHVRTKKLIKDFIKYRNWQMPQNPTIYDFLKGNDAIGVGILTCTITARRALCEQVIESDPHLHRSDYFLMGDTQLWAEISTMADLHYIPESLATHNLLEESVTRSKDVKKVLKFHISGAELRLYLCDKYDLPSGIRDLHEANWYDSSLRLAFHSRNAELADEVRQKKKTFTWKEWLRYCGAKHLMIYHICRGAALLPKLFRKRHNQWR
jgi:glycosyltransferase involved in cell wall biosynthesis